MIVSLTRFDSSDQGTFGRLAVDSFNCFTGELPWRNNAPLTSCIPAGRYTVTWTWSPRLRRPTYRLLGVPNRSGILLHSGNLMGDRSLGYRAQFLGCISLGEKLGMMEGQKALLVSRPAIRRFEELLRREPFTLEVIDHA